MKIRKGFVSNSSSSSFVALVDPDAWSKIKSELDEFQTEVLSKLNTKAVTLNDKPYVQFYSYMSEDWVGFEYSELSHTLKEDESDWVLMEKVDTAINTIRRKISNIATSGDAWCHWEDR